LASRLVPTEATPLPAGCTEPSVTDPPGLPGLPYDQETPDTPQGPGVFRPHSAPMHHTTYLSAFHYRRSALEGGAAGAAVDGGGELDADAKNLDLSKREADVALRAFLPTAAPPEHLIARRLVPITLCNYAGAAHAARLGSEQHARSVRWLGSNQLKIMEELAASSSYAEAPIWGTFNSMEVMAEAARAGLGLVMLPTYVGDPDPGLTRLPQPDLRHVADFWLLSHRDLRDNARLRAAREAIATGLFDHASLFRGEAEGWRETAPVCHELAPGQGASRT
jgi:hypothetical protein